MASLTQVSGFRAIGVTCGLKASGNPDLALILADTPCSAAAVFTTNLFKAAPVLYDIALLRRNQGLLQAVVINAGNANAVTGEPGRHNAERMARLTEELCRLPADRAFIMSTGVIGQQMPMAKLEAGIRQAAELIHSEAGQQGHQLTQAILTTDLVPKEALAQTTVAGHPVTVAGIAKGSGMIHPNMATMLGVLVTDARIEPPLLHTALKQAVAVSFNRVTVDGDTSTNDTVVILASGQSPAKISEPAEVAAFQAALTEVCTKLAKAIARDGEGATKLLEIMVRGATNPVQAETAAKTVATSPLFKTAIFGNDPNWGRALAAIGRSGAEVEPHRVNLWLGEFQLVAAGEPVAFDPVAAHNWLAQQDTVTVVADLGVGAAEATVWSCDFSYKYVEINAEYHT
jgi:glutamate N-acetyltransferase/amino-acid N-acetyltransferase